MDSCLEGQAEQMTWMQADTEHRKQWARGSDVANAWSKTREISGRPPCAIVT